jgi:peptidoglycan/LPS O-acetylase OafA/YrhL
MGVARFLLAISVLLWHAQADIILMNGYLAVIVFYMICGFYMAMVINEKYDAAIVHFYVARALRLLPLYWIVCLLTLATLFAFGACPRRTCATPTVLTAVSNFAVFGLDATALIGSLHPREAFLRIVAPAWSLGVEFQFYLLAPFIVRRSLRALAAITLIAVIGRLALLGADFSTWRYLFGPSTWCFFFLGALSYRIGAEFKHIPRWVAPAAIASVLASAWVAKVNVTRDLDRVDLWVFYFAVATSIPLVFHMTRNWRWDAAIGNLSYAIYLVHWPVLKLMGPGTVLLPLATTIGIASLLHVGFEAPINAIRARIGQRYRGRQSVRLRAAVHGPALPDRVSI